MSALPAKADMVHSYSPEVRKWGRYLIFDWIGLGKGNGRVQAYLAHDHWRDADKKWWCTHGKANGPS